jgi:hypothetical protein
LLRPGTGALRQSANVAQAFGHDTTAFAKNSPAMLGG